MNLFLSFNYSSHASAGLGGFEWYQRWKPVGVHRWNHSSKWWRTWTYFYSYQFDAKKLNTRPHNRKHSKIMGFMCRFCSFLNVSWWKKPQYDCEAALKATCFCFWCQDLLPWAPNQPDNWQDNEDCAHLRGMTHHEPGKLNDDFCTSTRDFICKKGLTYTIFYIHVLYSTL